MTILGNYFCRMDDVQRAPTSAVSVHLMLTMLRRVLYVPLAGASKHQRRPAVQVGTLANMSWSAWKL